MTLAVVALALPIEVRHEVLPPDPGLVHDPGRRQATASPISRRGVRTSTSPTRLTISLRR